MMKLLSLAYNISVAYKKSYDVWPPAKIFTLLNKMYVPQFNSTEP